MVCLVAMLSSGKGTWGQVSSLISSQNWDKIYLVCNEFAYDNFDVNSQKIIKLKVDETRPLEIFSKLSKFFRNEVKDFEVAVNINSGSGIEHMAVISSLLKSGLGIRFVYFKNNRVCEFEILDEKFIPEFDELDLGEGYVDI